MRNQNTTGSVSRQVYAQREIDRVYLHDNAKCEYLRLWDVNNGWTDQVL